MTGLQPVLGGRSARGDRDLGLGHVELVLDANEEGPDPDRGQGKGGLGHPDLGPELVEGAERGDPRGILQYAGAASEAGLPTVTGACV